MAVDLDEIMTEARQERSSAQAPQTPKSRSLVDDVLDEMQGKSSKSLSDLIRPVPAPTPEPSPLNKPVENFAEPVLGVTGALLGGMAGTPLGLPGMIAGGTLGYGGGVALSHAIGTATGERAAPTSALDALKQTGNLILEGGMFELGGRLLGKAADYTVKGGKGLLRALISGQAKAMTPEQQMIVETATTMGVHLRPSEITGRDVAAQVEQNARRSLFGRGKFQRLDDENSANLIHFYDTLAEQNFGKAQSPQELGRLVQAAITGQVVPDVQAVNRGLYQVLARQTGDAAIVSSESVLPRARALTGVFNEQVFPKSYAIAKDIEEIVSQRGPTTGLTVTSSMSKQKPEEIFLSPIKDALGRDIPSIVPATESQLLRLKVAEKSETPRFPKDLNFMQAHDARSKLLALTQTGEILSSREQKVAANLAESLDTAMEKAATSFDAAHGTNVVQDWRVANASVKASHELFDSAVIRKAVSATPEDLPKVAFTRNALTETDRIMDALKYAPAGKVAYQQAAFKELIHRSLRDGKIDPARMFEQAYGRNGVGEEVMGKTFQDLAPSMKKFLTAAEKMNVITTYDNVNPSQTGRSLINWFEQGMILSIPISATTGNLASVGAAVGSNAVYIVSIDSLARLINNQHGLRLMTSAMGVKPTTQEGLRIGGLLVKELAKMSDATSQQAQP